MKQLKITAKITNRNTAGLEKYLREIAKVPLLNHEEEVSLAKEIKSGSKEALEKLVKGNLRFVVSVAKQYQFKGLELGDLINEGNMGLIRAAQEFDETRGFKFISFAVWWIRQGILFALSEQSRVVRLPQNIVSKSNKVISACVHLEQLNEYPPTNEEIAESLSISTDEVAKLFKEMPRHLSLDKPIRQDDESTFGELLAGTEETDETLLQESRAKDIERILRELKPRHADIVKSLYGIGIENPLSMDEVSRKYDLTKNRIRQIKEIALKKLRKKADLAKLNEYL